MDSNNRLNELDKFIYDSSVFFSSDASLEEKRELYFEIFELYRQSFKDDE